MFQTTENRFDDYLSERYAAQRETVIDTIEEAYSGDGQWDSEILSALTQSAMHDSSRLLVRVVDASGEEITSEITSMGRHMQRMQGMGGSESGDWVEEEVELFSEGEYIGSAFISYPGVLDYTAEEADFLEDLTWLILLMGLFSVAVAGFIAYLISRRLSRPIAAISDRTRQIARGQDTGAADIEDEQISELYQLQQSVSALSAQLAQQKNIRNQMVSDLAHEVRTPLTTLQGNIEAMLDGVWEVTPERLNSLNRQVIRLANLVSMLDQLEDAEESSGQLTLETFDIKELLSTVKIAFEPQAREKGITLELDAESETIEADRNKLDQVMTNLLSNALKFTPKGGEIRLTAKCQGSECVVNVQDNGQGIPDSKRDFIFERFYQAEPSRNSELQGQGIGLAVVRSIVEAHKGTVTVDSEEGKGTTFTVSLPKTRNRRI